MEALRLKLKSSVANYKKEETIDNKTTYPLPPFSTVIGAIHKACGYSSYHKMDISIQGKFGSMGKKAYTYHWFLDSIMTDRDYLVKIRDPEILSSSFEKVAYFGERTDVLKPLIDSDDEYTSKSFKGAKLYNFDLADEYIKLKKLKNKFEVEKKEIYTPKIKLLKSEEKELKAKLKTANTDEKAKLTEDINKIKLEYKTIGETRKNYETINITKPLSYFKTLNISLKSYELLYDVELCIHIASDEEILKDVEENIYNLTAIGRSEDFVEIKEVKRVQLTSDFDVAESENTFYIDVNEIKSDGVIPKIKTGIASGTVYYINKDYEIIDGKRVFNKAKVLYCSNIEAYGEDVKKIYVDDDNMIVSLN